MRFRITPEGEAGWIVEKAFDSYYIKAFFWFRWKSPYTRWERQWLWKLPNGKLATGSSRVSSYQHTPVPWPESKDEIKKILDPIIEADKKLCAEKEATEKRIADRLKNNPPEEYP